VTTAKPAVQLGTFVDMANGTYPATKNISINDEIIDMSSSSTGTGKALFFIFDLATDVRDASNFKVRELFTTSYTYGTFDQVGNDITIGGVGSSAAAWQLIYGIDNPTLATGHVYEGYWQYWDKTADIGYYPYETSTGLSVEYSTDGGTTWSDPTSLTLNVVPEPTTVLAGLLLLIPLGTTTFRMVRKNRTA
jgi:hypothetical protein